MSSRATDAPDFGALAPDYDRLRPEDANWRELVELLVREGDLQGRRVLDVGCGTGQLAAALAHRHVAKVWGVDPSAEMLAVARARLPRGSRVKLGRAEQLPFRDGWFERLVFRLSLHLVDRTRALAEARRVLGADGRLVVATFDPAHFSGYWLNGLFPSIEPIDRARFPTDGALEAELRAAGFTSRLVRLDQDGALERAAALERIRGRFISTLRLLDEEEYRQGLARAEAELPERIAYRLRWLVAVAEPC